MKYLHETTQIGKKHVIAGIVTVKVCPLLESFGQWVHLMPSKVEQYCT